MHWLSDFRAVSGNKRQGHKNKIDFQCHLILLLIVLVDHLQKTKKESKNLKKQEMLTLFRKMSLIRLVLNMTWEFKDLARRTASNKILRNTAFNIAKNPNYDGYQRWLDSKVHKFFDKNCAGSGVNMHAKIMSVPWTRQHKN